MILLLLLLSFFLSLSLSTSKCWLFRWRGQCQWFRSGWWQLRILHKVKKIIDCAQYINKKTEKSKCVCKLKIERMIADLKIQKAKSLSITSNSYRRSSKKAKTKHVRHSWWMKQSVWTVQGNDAQKFILFCIYLFAVVCSSICKLDI